MEWRETEMNQLYYYRDVQNFLPESPPYLFIRFLMVINFTENSTEINSSKLKKKLRKIENYINEDEKNH